MRHIVIPAVVLTIASACGGGGDGGGTPPPPPIKVPASIAVSVSSTETMSSFGDTRTLTAVVRDSSQEVIASPTVSWTTSASGVASVSPTSGLTTTATAVGNGNATITATAGTVTGTATTAVLQRLSTVSVDPTSFSLNVGANRQLTPSGRDARGNAIAGASGFTFSSNNTGVATVSNTGSVSGVSAGSATITTSLTRDGVTATATSAVTVTSGGSPTTATVTTGSSSFSPASVEIAAGGTVTWQFGPIAHNVNFSAGGPSNIPTTSNASVARTFPTAGSFPYFCNIHDGMNGTVVVN